MIKYGIHKLLSETPHGVFEVTLLGPGTDYQAQFRLTNLGPGRITDPFTRASVAGDQPLSYGNTVISGTNALTTISVPSGFKGMIALRPTGAFTGATGGTWADDGIVTSIPIGLAFTAVVGKILYMFTDGLLFYPSYTA